MNDLAIQKISETLKWDLGDSFQDKSYSKLAVYEIMNRLHDRPLEFPEIVVEAYIYELTIMIESLNVSTKRHILEVARDTAEDILSIVSSM